MCDCFWITLLITTVVCVEGSIGWWVADGFLKLEEFNEISPWLGPWNLSLAFLYLVLPWTLMLNQKLLDDYIYERQAKVLMALNIILIIGFGFCVGLFYWLIIGHWGEIDLQYKIAWITVMVPLNLGILAGCFYGMLFLVIKIIDHMRFRKAERIAKVRANIYSYIYDKKFDLRKYSNILDYEFFTQRLKTKELDLLKNNFSETYKVKDDENCIICYTQLYETLVTSVPCCNHKYHFECQKEWSGQKSICPQDRNYLRLLMVKHYHKNYKPPNMNDVAILPDIVYNNYYVPLIHYD